MSGYFDGRNGRLSKTWRFRRSGKSVKTLGDMRNLGDLQFEEICWNWNCCRFTWQVYVESPESYLVPSRGAVWGYPELGTIHGASGVCTRYTRRYGSV